MRALLSVSLIALATPAAAQELTLKRVMLSTAGVGYFELSGSLQGTGTIGLDVPLKQVDDVLASLTVFDDHGGVGSVELPGRDSNASAFADVPFTEDQLNSPVALLRSLRGQELAVSGPVAMQGRIVTVDIEAAPVSTYGEHVAPQPPNRTRVTLLTADGFRQFIFEDATAIRLTDAALSAHIGVALNAARQQAAAEMRHLTLRSVTLHSTGQGARALSVGYVTEAPLWKASYRVIVPPAGGDHARVQGWAVLENQSGADWKGVDLTLQSGNPVTFHQAIYASYYANRPDVPVEVMGRLLPDPDQRATESVNVQAQRRLFGGTTFGSLHGAAMMAAPAPPPESDAVQAVQGPGVAASAAVAAPAMSMPAETAKISESVADTSFHIPSPVDLARGHTASVPIIDRSIPADQLDLLPANSTRPITALRLTNTLATSLPAGILTLYTQGAAGAAFAGDARLAGLPAGQNRLLAFAEDLRLSATRNQNESPEVLQHVKMAGGVLTQSILSRIVMKATLSAPAHDAATVLVEFPKNGDARLVLPDGEAYKQEETASAWRLTVPLKPGETKTVVAYADTPENRTETLMPADGDFDNDLVVNLLSTRELDATARKKLTQLEQLRGAEASRRSILQKFTAQRDTIDTDEQRLRANLQAVGAAGDLHDKLLSALDSDESELARLRADIRTAEASVAEAHQALADTVKSIEF
jgi:hypothetical protein